MFPSIGSRALPHSAKILRPVGPNAIIGRGPAAALDPWSRRYKVLQVGDGSAPLTLASGLDPEATNGHALIEGAYLGSGSWRYSQSDHPPTAILFLNGVLYFRTAPTGTKDAAITWTTSTYNADGTWTLASGLTNANLANMAAHTYKGNNTGSTAAPSDVSAANLAIDIGAVVRVKYQVFTGSATYTPSAGMIYAVVEAIGGGGGGGSAAGTVGQFYAGAGGGSGGYSRKIVSAADIGASKTVTIGAGGSGGASGSNNGSAGGDTSLGTLCIGKGGSGGQFGSAAQVALGGAGGVAGTGDVAANGQPGNNGFYNSLANTVAAWSGAGGGVSGGGGNPSSATSGNAVAGNSGNNYGGGGSGAVANNAASNAAGGNGSAGIVIVTEFCTQ